MSCHHYLAVLDRVALPTHLACSYRTPVRRFEMLGSS